MALIHRATLTPSKLELLTSWLPTRSWFTASPAITHVGAYRFDDPAGEVGLQGMLIQADGDVIVHVPLSYRGAPLPGADDFLLGTAEHSVLGTRWVYDASGDPVWATALATAILAGGEQAEEVMDVDGELVPRPPTVRVHAAGSRAENVAAIETVTAHDEGATTVVTAGSVDIVVVREIGTEVAGDARLIGSWDGTEAATLAVATVRR
ncbi:hypothetical protein [Haloactinopolyspora sp.]|uniref:CG0192-related protein n=1 Tax=Haloactinopolyspora sp. TaxID=1966353 RepID=UPI00262EFE13|nr:hypothetical protein [Haloactinopolyspora sp.]